MNRVCLTKDGKLIEMQSGGKVEVTMEIAEAQLITEGAEGVDQDAIIAKYRYLLDEKDRIEGIRLNTLKQNALNAGYQEDEIEVFWEEDTDFEIRMAAQRESELTYVDRRLAEYPTYADYLDGVVKGDQLQIDKYIADCLAVKARHPKPE